MRRTENTLIPLPCLIERWPSLLFSIKEGVYVNISSLTGTSTPWNLISLTRPRKSCDYRWAVTVINPGLSD